MKLNGDMIMSELKISFNVWKLNPMLLAMIIRDLPYDFRGLLLFLGQNFSNQILHSKNDGLK